MKRLLIIVLLGLSVAACGVKNDLEKPDGTQTQKNAPNPSQPPYPVGR